MLLLYAFMIGLMALGNSGIAILAVIPPGSISANCRWLLALPISRRKLFAWVAASPTVAVGVGSVVAAVLTRKRLYSPQERAINFSMELAAVYFAIFLLELPDWRSLSKWRMWVKWIRFGFAFATMPLFNTWRILPLFDRPQWWPLFFVLPLATYWLAEKAFVKQEYPRPLVPANQYRNSWT
jgi:hypothetical protein